MAVSLRQLLGEQRKCREVVGRVDPTLLTPSRRWLCAAANGFDADFSPYQSTRLRR
jgi:hypothetical protein